MTCLDMLRGAFIAAVCCAAGFAWSADSAESTELKEQALDASRRAGQISRSAEKEGKRIAKDASDFAKEAAESFREGYDDGKVWD